MAFNNLQEAIRYLESDSELVRIKEPLSIEYDITEVTDRVVKEGGPALLFENPVGYEHKVLTNLYGTEKRICKLFGINNIEELESKISGLLDVSPPGSFFDKLRILIDVIRAGSYFPKKVKSGPCQEIVLKEDADLRQIPVLKCWPGDGGRFITLPVVITKDPETGRRNLGMYRMQIYDSKTAGLHWHIHKDGAGHFRKYTEGKEMPVVVSIGPDPITTYCATAPLPDGIDELMLSGLLRESPVELVRCITCDLEVPSESQFVLEGYVKAGEERIEGPFGDHTGFYSPEEPYPVFHLKAITMRKDAIYHATVVGLPPMEDQWLGKITERLFLPLIRLQLPEIHDINLPVEGCFHNLCFVSIDKRYPGHARKVMNALWGMGQMMFSKMIFVFDREVDVQDISQVLFHLGSNVDPGRDIVVLNGPVDALDHASGIRGYGSKMGVDCTRKFKEEGYPGKWPKKAIMTPEVQRRIDEIWNRLGL